MKSLLELGMYCYDATWCADACREALWYKKGRWQQGPLRVWPFCGRTTTCWLPRPQEPSPFTPGPCKPFPQVHFLAEGCCRFHTDGRHATHGLDTRHLLLMMAGMQVPVGYQVIDCVGCSPAENLPSTRLTYYTPPSLECQLNV